MAQHQTSFSEFSRKGVVGRRQGRNFQRGCRGVRFTAFTTWVYFLTDVSTSTSVLLQPSVQPEFVFALPVNVSQ